MLSNSEKYSYVTQADYEAAASPDWPPYSVYITHHDIPDWVYREVDERLSAPKTFAHPSFCVLPFYGLEYPQNTFCCLTTPGSSREVVKQEILNGRRATACNKCWSIEDAGLKSDRMIKNETADYYANRNIEDLYKECVNSNAEIIHYKIDTNNVCNSTCVTCGSLSSSAWAKLEKDNNHIPISTWQSEPADVDQIINYSTAKSIGFRGGEPFMSKTTFYILEKLVEHQNYNCFISFTTNGSVGLTDKQLSLVKKFHKINFGFSIDGIDSVFEYIRYPLKFNQIIENIKFCNMHNIDVSVSYTLSNLNVLYHNQTTQWFRENNLRFLVNPVYHPKHFRPGCLPEKIKQQIKKNIEPEILGFINTHSHQDDLDFEKFKKEIAKQDRWKNIQLKHYLPELAKLIDQYS